MNTWPWLLAAIAAAALAVLAVTPHPRPSAAADELAAACERRGGVLVRTIDGRAACVLTARVVNA